jgi:nicotinate-nucleotide pyrophosphorylase (carboxylating)
LNVLARLSGIASLTRRFVEAVAGTKARIFDTRKTNAAWRRLEKYAVRCGGGWNHRGGLHEAVLIKDNHLAVAATADAAGAATPADAVTRAREFLQRFLPAKMFESAIIEVEVDSLEQLDAVLPVRPDIVLLDNFSIDMLHEAVRRRDASAADVELEASGGITLETVAEVAATGVERISVGALTHSAPALNLGLDWSIPPR